jgi:imidazolonepropionase
LARKRIINISQLSGTNNNEVRLGPELSILTSISNAYLDIEDDRINGFGSMSELGNSNFEGETINAKGRSVLPMFIDCHTHLVFAESREQEFEDRLNGLSYQEIAERGGGILNSADKLAAKSEEDLFQDAMIRLDTVIRTGTGAIEIKSGYGLSTDSELKMLRVIRRIKEEAPIPVRATFLGAHAIPSRYKDEPKKYLDEVINDMFPAIAKEGLADYADIFCEKGYFELEETERILKAAQKHNIASRIHVNQFYSIGGIELASKMGVKSVEHLEVLSEDDMRVLKGGSMFTVALPGCSFYLKIPYTPARKLIDAGIPFAIASDFNPGSAPTGNLGFAFTLACLYMEMQPSEVFNSLTINAAHALDIQNEVGSIDIGKKANFMILKNGMSIASIPYNLTENVIDQVWLNGEVYN